MTRVRLPESVLAELRSTAATDSREVRGGLLLGYRMEGKIWIERILACRNVAEQTRSAFRPDPGAIENVRHSLAASALEILGWFLGGGDVPGNDSFEEPQGLMGSETLCLVTAADLVGTGVPRFWGRNGSDSPAELPVEIVASRVGPIPCRE